MLDVVVNLCLLLFAVVLGLAIWWCMRAQEAGLRSKLEKRVYDDGFGHSLPYRIYVPRQVPPEGAALVLFLHGAGERGNDNQRQLAHPEVLRLVRHDVQAAKPFLLVAPQCPPDHQWVEVPWNEAKPHQMPEQPSLPMRLVLGLLDELETQHRIDPARRYLTGFSMGGFGVMDALLRRPQYWAAAVPVCGGADDQRVKAAAGVAVWAFHGARDAVVPPARSRSMIEALHAAGASPRYTEYAGIGHNSWTKAYREPDLIDWLWSQTRQP